MKVNEGAISNVSIYESNSYMVLEYRKLEYNKELKFFKLKFCVTFLIKMIHISSIFFMKLEFLKLKFHVKLNFLKLKF